MRAGFNAAEVDLGVVSIEDLHSLTNEGILRFEVCRYIHAPSHSHFGPGTTRTVKIGRIWIIWPSPWPYMSEIENSKKTSVTLC